MSTATVNHKAPAISALLEPSNDGHSTILAAEPYFVRLTLRGPTMTVWHKWSVESIEAKGKAAKGSDVRKTDDVESYVWRNEDNQLCLPGEYVRQCMIVRAKQIPDPSYPRRSAKELYKSSIAALTELAPILIDGKPVVEWEGIDQRRVVVQRAGVTRSRPFMNKGWQAEMDFLVLQPEYISFDTFHENLSKAGTFVGLAEMRPSYGRFSVVNIKQVAWNGED